MKVCTSSALACLIAHSETSWYSETACLILIEGEREAESRKESKRAALHYTERERERVSEK